MPAENVNMRPFTEPRPTGRQRRSAIAPASTAAADSVCLGSRSCRANTELAPAGTNPISASGGIPLATSLAVPSPPIATTTSAPGARARSVACPGRSVRRTSTSPTRASRAATWSISAPCTPEAFGLTIRRTCMRATIVGVTAANLRTYTAVAGVPAALVVLLHLALDWNGADGISGRRDLAFSHGVALAVVLAAVLISSRVALYIETGAGAPVADAVAIIGSVAVLANLARVWRDGSNPLHRLSITVAHITALLLVAAASNLVARREQRRRSNPAPSL